MIVTWTVEVLLPAFGSGVALVTTAVLLTEPAVDGAVTVRVRLALLPAANVVIVHVTTRFVASYDAVPVVGVADTYVSPAASVSVTVTVLASIDPAVLLTPIV